MKRSPHELIITAVRLATWSVAAATLLCVCGPATVHAQDIAGPTQVVPRGITVSGHAEIKAAPDIVRADLAIETTERGESEAVQRNAEKLHAVMGALAQAGIAATDIQTESYSVTPQYDYDARPAVLTGYDVADSIEVNIRKPGQAGIVLDSATRAGATVDNVSFDIEHKEALRRRVLADAVTDARANAEAAAQAAGVSVGPLTALQDVSGPSPIVRPMPVFAMARVAAPAAPATQLSPHRITISVNVVATYGIDNAR